MEQAKIHWFDPARAFDPDTIIQKHLHIVFLPKGGHWVQEGDIVFLPPLFLAEDDVIPSLTSLRGKKVMGICILIQPGSEISKDIVQYIHDIAIPGAYASIEDVRGLFSPSALMKELKENLIELSRNENCSLINILRMIDFTLGTESEIFSFSLGTLISPGYRREPLQHEPPFSEWAWEIQNLPSQETDSYSPRSFSFGGNHYFGYPLFVHSFCQGVIFFRTELPSMYLNSETYIDIIPFILMNLTVEIDKRINSKRRKEEFLWRVLFGYYNNDRTLVGEADLYDIQYTLNRFVWILRIFPDGIDATTNYSVPQVFVNRITNIIAAFFPKDVSIYDHTQIICIHVKDNEKDESLTTKYNKLIRRIEEHLQGFSCMIGVSRAYGNLYDLKKAYNDALFSVRMARLIFKENKKFCSYDDLLIYHLLYDQVDNPILHRLFANTIKLIDIHDRDKDDLLRETIKALIEHNYNMKQAANALNIHRNTLYQRIEKIEEILGFSLRSSRGRLVLQLGETLDLIMKGFLKQE
ncbi:PucR family transcriptional regulator [Sediminispirochaeta bajacaliforniensis]|uniref:PucR family transcriptional regulator n=1 Tax=Sediminispirochaeta bajacaliforniensis TaxID=148 RepID=UPI000366AE86|nr:PucR family transcriptional regulator [Sediminispirochaeta bajacaliforniensis]